MNPTTFQLKCAKERLELYNFGLSRRKQPILRLSEIPLHLPEQDENALMSSIRVRKPFAAAFAVLLVAAAYLGLSSPKIPQYGHSDKGLHFVTFFLLTLLFYWIIETSRRRLVHLTLLVCTAGLAIGSEIVQGLVPNGREFDPFDIVANVVGSALALLLSSWYHRRMLERRRKNKHYDIVPGEEVDVELGEGVGVSSQETGVVEANGPPDSAPHKTNVTEELDHWDENAEDWEDNATLKHDSAAEEGKGTKPTA